MNLNKIYTYRVSIKEMLNDIKYLLMLEKIYDRYEGPTSFSGIKRIIYSLFNNGENERGEDITLHMGKRVYEKYIQIQEKYTQSQRCQSACEFEYISYKVSAYDRISCKNCDNSRLATTREKKEFYSIK